MQFKDIKGQIVISNKLTEIADSGRISHALRFVGNTQAGSLALAIAYVQYLNCKDRQHYGPDYKLRADSCGVCPSCKKMQQLVHSDLHFYFPNTTTSKVKKDPSCASFQKEFRDFLNEYNQLGTQDDWYAHLNILDKANGMIRTEDAADILYQLSLKAYENQYKMVIIWLPEKMNDKASNMLLKEIEEPYSNSIIIMVTESEEQLLSTIVSRTQRIKIPLPQIEGELWIGDATIRKEDRELFASMFVTWMRQLFKLNMLSLSTGVEEAAKLNKEQMKQFLAYSQEALRECFVAHCAGLPMQMDFGDDKFNKSFPQMITEKNIEGLCKGFDHTIFSIERNAYAKINLMNLSFSISKCLKNK